MFPKIPGPSSTESGCKETLSRTREYMKTKKTNEQKDCFDLPCGFGEQDHWPWVQQFLHKLKGTNETEEVNEKSWMRNDKEKKGEWIDESTLDGSRISFKSDDFTNKIIMTNTNKFVHGSTAHSIRNDDRSRNLRKIIARPNQQETPNNPKGIENHKNARIRLV